jgi:hypothetical protein
MYGGVFLLLSLVSLALISTPLHVMGLPPSASASARELEHRGDHKQRR